MNVLMMISLITLKMFKKLPPSVDHFGEVEGSERAGIGRFEEVGE